MRRLLLALVAICIAAVAAPALAAPAREASLAADQPFTWEGGPGTGVMPTGGSQVRCTPVYECEDTLVKLTEDGDLTAVIKAGSGSTDLDVAIFESDESGAVAADSPTETEPQTPRAEDVSENADAKATARKLKAGFYVIRVRFYGATAGTYTGTATLAGAPKAVEPEPVAAPVAAPSPQPAAPAKPAAKKKKPTCTQKAKKIKNAKKRKAALKKCKRAAKKKKR